ncbi:MAG: PepSY-associated TM helix domain-containing protein [Ignavibacteriaceae bacterium]|nr:PepSY-associated TM helix domain-containing protein [Ignavibacteriaceae bacterium]NUM71502.1 PepSY-associated TM helix domain-containing protein [Ignavibacteriaceae bacterium]
MTRLDKTRKYLRQYHRDIGYIIAVLVIIYSVSGVAVNHIDDWNPNYSVEKIDGKTDPVNPGDKNDDQLAQIIINKLNITEQYKTSFRETEEKFKIFFEGNEVEFNLSTGEYSQVKIQKRWFLKEFNVLHKNEVKKVWTYVADVFAVLLIVLAVSGLIMVKGSKGFVWRGLILSLIGTAIPVFFLWLYFW